MALTKKVYVDNQTVIPAANLNAIQDEVIANATAIEGKAPAQHTHTKSQITDLTDYTLPTASASTLGGVKVGAGLSINNGVLSANGGGTADSVDWSNIQNKPATFPPSAHTHSQYLTEQSLKTINGESLVGTGNITIEGGSGEPTEYLKSAAVSGNTLTLTKKDNSTVVFTPTTGGGDSALTNKLDKDGDGSNVTVAFTAASTRNNIATGEKLSVLFGKIAKWFADLGSLAFKSTVAKSDLASDVQTSLGKADSALQSYTETDPTVPEWAKEETKPSYSKSEVGLGNVDNVKQYSASNPPPYPVTSVNGKTGAVTVNVPTVPFTASILKGNGSGGLVAATRGSDYIASGNIVKQTLVATETTPTEDYAINWVYGN